DATGIHAFPGMWWDARPCWDRRAAWRGWRQKVRSIRPALRGLPLWVTETGRSTWDPELGTEGLLDEQVRRLEEASRAPVERSYWYSLIDLDPAREAIEGFHVEENEYHMGLVRHDGPPKPAYERFRELLARQQDPSGVRR